MAAPVASFPGSQPHVGQGQVGAALDSKSSPVVGKEREAWKCCFSAVFRVTGEIIMRTRYLSSCNK